MNCKYCNKPIKIYLSSKKKYCSKLCLNRYWLENRRESIGYSPVPKVWNAEFFDWRDFPNGIL